MHHHVSMGKHAFDKHQPHVGKALVLGPTWTLPQEEIRISCECHMSPRRPHAPRGQALTYSIPCLSSRTGCPMCGIQCKMNT